MRHRHLLPIDPVVMDRGLLARIEVRDELMAEEIKIDPFRGAATLGAPQQLSIEGAGGRQVVYGNGEVKGLH